MLAKLGLSATARADRGRARRGLRGVVPARAVRQPREAHPPRERLRGAVPQRPARGVLRVVAARTAPAAPAGRARAGCTRCSSRSASTPAAARPRCTTTSAGRSTPTAPRSCASTASTTGSTRRCSPTCRCRWSRTRRPGTTIRCSPVWVRAGRRPLARLVDAARSTARRSAACSSTTTSTAEHYLARYEASRGMSPFNTALYATRNTDDARVTLAFGQRFERRADGITSTAARRRPRPRAHRGVRLLGGDRGATPRRRPARRAGSSLRRMVMTLLPHYETADVRIEKIVVGPFENNVFVLRSKSNGDAVIIDAANEHELLLEVSQRTGVRRVLTTHGHFDHIQAVTQMRDAGIDVGIAAEDAEDAAELRLRDPRRRRDRGRRPAPAHDPHARVTRRAPRASCSRATRSCFSGDTLFPGGPGNTTFEDAELRHDHRVDRPPPVHAAGRHARAARPRPRHDDRERVAASRRVDRARLVARDRHDSNGFLSRDGDDVYFETLGAPDAPVVVLGHGAGGNHGIWFQQVPVFARDYRVVTWDQRGFGTLDEPQRPREPAHRDRRPARDPRPPRRRARARRRPVDGRLGRDGPRGRARRSRAQPRARRHARRHRDRRMVEGGRVGRATRGPVQPSRARRTTSASGTRNARTSTCRSAGCAGIRTPTRRSCCARWAR